MIENKVVQDVIYLVSCAANETVPEPDRVQTMNLTAVYALAGRHMLTAAVAMALESAGFRDAMSTKAISESVRRAARFDTERAAVLQKMEEVSIWYLPVKGSVLKDLYPKYGMRQMADNDILYDASRATDVKTIMERLGFVTDQYYGRSIHDHYFKPPVCNFEMHRMLFGAGHDQRLIDYYHDVKSRLLPDEGRNYGYHFSDEDFYVYMIAHEYKHYSGGGTGLRSLLDTYVYLSRKGESMDWSYINGELEKLGISEFEAQNRSLALHLFSGEALADSDEEMLNYILSSGTYGTREHSVRNKVNKLGGGVLGKVKYLFGRIFLPMSIVQSAYPFFYRLTIRRKMVQVELKALVKLQG